MHPLEYSPSWLAFLTYFYNEIVVKELWKHIIGRKSWGLVLLADGIGHRESVWKIIKIKRDVWKRGNRDTKKSRAQFKPSMDDIIFEFWPILHARI